MCSIRKTLYVCLSFTLIVYVLLIRVFSKFFYFVVTIRAVLTKILLHL